MSESKTQVTHVDIAKSEVVRQRFDANTSRMREIYDEVVMSLTRKQSPVRQIPRRGSKFIFECESCTCAFVEPPSLPSEECRECGSQVHVLEIPSDVWDQKYEVVYR